MDNGADLVHSVLKLEKLNFILKTVEKILNNYKSRGIITIYNHLGGCYGYQLQQIVEITYR